MEAKYSGRGPITIMPGGRDWVVDNDPSMRTFGWYAAHSEVGKALGDLGMQVDPSAGAVNGAGEGDGGQALGVDLATSLRPTHLDVHE